MALSRNKLLLALLATILPSGVALSAGSRVPKIGPHGDVPGDAGDVGKIVRLLSENVFQLQQALQDQAASDEDGFLSQAFDGVPIGPMQTSMKLSSKQVEEIKQDPAEEVVEEEPTAEPTAEPTVEPTAEPTTLDTQVILAGMILIAFFIALGAVVVGGIDVHAAADLKKGEVGFDVARKRRATAAAQEAEAAARHSGTQEAEAAAAAAAAQQRPPHTGTEQQQHEAPLISREREVREKFDQWQIPIAEAPQQKLESAEAATQHAIEALRGTELGLQSIHLHLQRTREPPSGNKH